jgi:hypothetical protein
MKKLVLAMVLSAFSFTTAAAYACDGMKSHETTDQTQAKASSKKHDKKHDTKNDQRT